MVKGFNVFLFILGFIGSSAQLSPFPLPNIPANQITVGYDTLSNIVIPTGTNDSSTYIQQALDNISSNTTNTTNSTSTGTGGTVLIGAGTYILKTQLLMNPQTHLQGSGMDITILKLADFATSWQQGTKSSAGFIRSHMIDDQQISHITLDGNKANQRLADNYGRYGVFTEGAHRVLFDTVKIQDFQGYGFDPHGWKKGGPAYGDGLTILNCISKNNEWDGFTLDQTYNIFLSNNTAIDNGRHGYNVVTGSRNVIIKNNIALNNGFYDPHGGTGCGFMIQNNMGYGTGDAVFEENYVDQAMKAGFCTNGVFNISLTSNIIINSTLCAIINDTTDSNFTNNICSNIAANNSIILLGGSNNIITPNDFNYTGVLTPILPISPSPPPSPSPSPPPVIESPPPIIESPPLPPDNSLSQGNSVDSVKLSMMSILGAIMLMLIL
jgi:hypothetical protein